MKRPVIIFLFLCCYNLQSQFFSVFDVNTANRPIIKAKFYACDSAGKMIDNVSPSDFEVRENGELMNVLSVSCPKPQTPDKLSSVLVIDISGSMEGNKREIAKECAKTWINGLPNGRFECAISAFNTINFIVQDFTSDKAKLENKIIDLMSSGGTDYNAALQTAMAGGLFVAKKGKYKKVVIILTDGQPNFEPKTQEIIKQANLDGIIVYAVTLGFSCPQCLRDISTQTGGRWFENVTTIQQAKEVYSKLLLFAQNEEPCSIEWQSNLLCWAGATELDISILQYGLRSGLSYQTPNSKIPKLEFKPAKLNFQRVMKDTCVKIKITACYEKFNITNIISSNPAYRIEPPTSFSLNSWESKELTVCYSPVDSGITFSKFTVENDLCPAVFYGKGGFPGVKPSVQTLKLIHPNGGEVFLAGDDTVITWSGVLPDDPVRIEYSIDKGVNWLPITETANGLSYKWHVPKTPGNQCLARVTAKANYGSIDSNMVLIPAGTFQMGNTGLETGIANEIPVHSVTISNDFYMSKFEISQTFFYEVMGYNTSNSSFDESPVNKISWYEAVNFCNALSLKYGLEPCYSGTGTEIECDWEANGYRLPTEAEWEYACKAGTTSDYYSTDNKLDSIAWFRDNSNKYMHLVGEKKPNLYGLYDMSGNLSEWCWDKPYVYRADSVTDPKGPVTGTGRMIRGGAFDSNASECRSSYRIYYYPESSKVNTIGFRIVRAF